MGYFETDAGMLSGKPVFLYHFFGTNIGNWRFNNGVYPFTLTGQGVYQPWAIRHDDTAINMTGDRSDLQVTLAAGSTLDAIYTDYPPSSVLNIVIRRTHEDTTGVLTDCPIIWTGRVSGIEFNGASEVEMTCNLSSAASSRPGLRRNYQINCPLLLYGPDCRASKANATVTRTVSAVSGDEMVVGSTVNGPRFRGGLARWINSTGQVESHQIRNVDATDNRSIRLQGKIRDLPVGTSVDLTFGCNHTMTDCANIHNNIANYGGQPFIPLENPATSTNSIFY